MLSEAIKAFADLVAAGHKCELVEVPGDPRRVWISQGGSYTAERLMPAIREHRVASLPDILEAAAVWVGDSTEGAGVMWHNEEQVVLVLDDEDRRDRVTLPLTVSGQFLTLERLHNSPALDQRAFVRLLKHDLYRVVDPALLLTVRRLEVSSGGSRSSEINPGRERGTQEFREELAGAADIPEYVDAVASVYSTLGLRVERTLCLSLDYELPAMRFQLEPLPDELTIAKQNAQLELHEALERGVPDGMPVLYGSP